MNAIAEAIKTKIAKVMFAMKQNAKDSIKDKWMVQLADAYRSSKRLLPEIAFAESCESMGTVRKGY